MQIDKELTQQGKEREIIQSDLEHLQTDKELIQQRKQREIMQRFRTFADR